LAKLPMVAIVLPSTCPDAAATASRWAGSGQGSGKPSIACPQRRSPTIFPWAPGRHSSRSKIAGARRPPLCSGPHGCGSIVKRRDVMTPPALSRSNTCYADRRRDPVPIYSLSGIGPKGGSSGAAYKSRVLIGASGNSQPDAEVATTRTFHTISQQIATPRMPDGSLRSRVTGS
jgi:hypothetical protein